MSTKHTLLILFVVFLLGSAYPTGKLGLNDSIPPILFGGLRMLIVFLCLIPFFKFQTIERKYIIPLIGFSICFGVMVNMFLYLSINASSILAPITIGAQLSIPFGIILSSIFLSEKISYKKWLLIMTSFFGIVILAFDPKVVEELTGSLLICCMAFFYGLSQVFSRYLKNLDVKFTNTFMSLVGFVILFTLSVLFEGTSIQTIKINMSFPYVMSGYNVYNIGNIDVTAIIPNRKSNSAVSVNLCNDTANNLTVIESVVYCFLGP